MSVTLTDRRGAARPALHRKARQGIGLRLGVKTTGCSGLAYKLEFADERNTRTGIRDNGVRVLIDPKSLGLPSTARTRLRREGLNEASSSTIQRERTAAAEENRSTFDRHFETAAGPSAYAVDPPPRAGYRDCRPGPSPTLAAGSDAERRVAMQWATRANEAYRTLRDPVERARYILHLKGYETDEESNTSMPPDFLMQQMEWREGVAAASAAHDPQGLQRLQAEIAGDRDAMIALLAKALDREANYDAGRSLVRKLRFLDKLEEEIEEGLERMNGGTD
jgi:molecular chaperone HscB